MKKMLSKILAISILSTTYVCAENIVHNGIVYDTVTSPYTGEIWLDRNIGASQVCTSRNDSACYGDYYQWGRDTDGHEKSSSPLQSTLATDINNVGDNYILRNEESPHGDWVKLNIDGDSSQRTEKWSSLDGSSVCPSGFRVPTENELKAETINEGVSNYNSAYNSFLKLPSAGARNLNNGSMLNVNSYGYIWTTSLKQPHPLALYFYSSGSIMDILNSTFGSSVRCIQDELVIINEKPISNPQTVNTSTNVTVNITLSASDNENNILTYTVVTNPINGTLVGAAPNLVYIPNTEYSGEDSFTFKVNDGTNDSEIEVININMIDVFQAGESHQGITYNTVISPYTGKIWLDRNIGASQVCTSRNDSACYGDYYQWGRDTDGHEKSSSPLQSTLATDINNVGDNYILRNEESPHGDWVKLNIDGDSSQRTEKWSSLDGSSVCPSGFRVPTENELKAETINEGVSNYNSAYNSFLKLPSAGARNLNNGSMLNVNSYGYIWTTSLKQPHPLALYFYSSGSIMDILNSTFGSSVRCIQDETSIVNLAPTAIAGEDQNVTNNEEVTLDGSLSSDDGSIVSFSWSENGNEIGTGETFTTSDLSVGTHIITLTVTDNYGAISSDSVVITVKEIINKIPTANSQIINTSSNVPIDITLTGSDDNDTLTYTIVTQPTNGTLTDSAPNLKYTPNTDYVGNDSFTFKINDGTNDSEIEVININIINMFSGGETHNGITYNTIISPNTGKVWLDRNLGASQVCTSKTDVACYGDYYQWGRDADGHENLSSPTQSTLATDINNVGSNYILRNEESPRGDWTLEDDDNSQRVVKWSSLDGSSVCPAGYRVPTENELQEETVDNRVTDNHSAYNNFLKLPSAGSRNFNNGTMLRLNSYGSIWSTSLNNSTHPHALEFSSASLQITIYNATSGLNVRCIQDESIVTNEVPIAQAGEDQNIKKGDIVTLDASASTDDGTIVSYSWSENGNEIGTGEAFTTSDLSVGTHIITLTVTDNYGVRGLDTIEVTTTPNEIPIANPQTLTINDNIALDIVLTASDDDNDTLTYTIVTQPTNATLTGSAPNLKYTPNTDYVGNDSFTFKVNDGTVDSEIVSIDLEIIGGIILIHNEILYSTVISPYTGKIWLDRNLGASRVCTALDDAACYGDYYQWGRNADGHEKIPSASSHTLATDINNSGSDFISSREFDDWASVDLNGSQRSSNWSKTDGSSICPLNYRVPTLEELKAETLDKGVKDNASAYSNFLKLPSAGYTEFGNIVIDTNLRGHIWSTTPSELIDGRSRTINFRDNYIAYTNHDRRRLGYGVRCIYEPLPLDIGLLAHYKFDRNTYDSSGNNRHGVGPNDLTYDDGILGQSASFDGATKVIADDFAGFDWGENFSVSVWFKRTGEFENYQGIVNTGYYDEGSWEVRLGRENEGTWIGAGIATSPNPQPWSNTNFAAQHGWHHFVMTYDGGTLLTYLDNEVVSTTLDSGSILVKNKPLTIGENGGGWEYFYGQIDDVRLYHRTLDADEVESLYDMNVKAPTAVAGDDQTAYENYDVTLDASLSTDNGSIESYTWNENGNVISTEITFSKNDFTIGTHTITLTVTDNEGHTDTDEVIVTIMGENIAPIAEAGDNQTVLVNTIVIFDASASSDSNGYITDYSWNYNGNIVSTNSTYSIVGLPIGTHTITLTVTDNEGATDTDSFTLFVNEAPVANAGADQIIIENNSVTLNGSASTDNGFIVSYTWTENYSVLSTDSSFTKSDFTLGTHTVTLRVQDNLGAISTDTVLVIVTENRVVAASNAAKWDDGSRSFSIHNASKAASYSTDSGKYYLEVSALSENTPVKFGTTNMSTDLGSSTHHSLPYPVTFGLHLNIDNGYVDVYELANEFNGNQTVFRSRTSSNAGTYQTLKAGFNGGLGSHKYIKINAGQEAFKGVVPNGYISGLGPL